jgi:glutathione S-transferase
MLTLYQFPISHYCEKARWALAYKGLEHTTKNLLPGFHIKKARKMTGHSAVPILEHDGKYLGESSSIITYLDEIFPEKMLTPSDPDLRQEALEWERFADEKIGANVRCACYDILLEYPDIVIPFFTVNGPWYGNFVLKRMFPKMRQSMRKFMKINRESAKQSMLELDQATDKISSHLQGKKFMVGDQFSRADLAVASLLAPLCMPGKYGLDWPQNHPEDLAVLVARYAEKLHWVTQLYAGYR